jgi:hypothetical protein
MKLDFELAVGAIKSYSVFYPFLCGGESCRPAWPAGCSESSATTLHWHIANKVQLRLRLGSNLARTTEHGNARLVACSQRNRTRSQHFSSLISKSLYFYLRGLVKKSLDSRS